MKRVMMQLNDILRSTRFRLNEVNFEQIALYSQETDELLSKYRSDKSFGTSMLKRNSVLETDLSSIHPINNSGEIASTNRTQSLISP